MFCPQLIDEIPVKAYLVDAERIFVVIVKDVFTCLYFRKLGRSWSLWFSEPKPPARDASTLMWEPRFAFPETNAQARENPKNRADLVPPGVLREIPTGSSSFVAFRSLRRRYEIARVSGYGWRAFWFWVDVNGMPKSVEGREIPYGHDLVTVKNKQTNKIEIINYDPVTLKEDCIKFGWTKLETFFSSLPLATHTCKRFDITQ
jgi:hypothetical protein